MSYRASLADLANRGCANDRVVSVLGDGLVLDPRAEPTIPPITYTTGFLPGICRDRAGFVAILC